MLEDEDFFEYIEENYDEYYRYMADNLDKKVDENVRYGVRTEDEEFRVSDLTLAHMAPHIHKLFIKYGIMQTEPKSGGVAKYTTKSYSVFECPYCGKHVNYYGTATEWTCDTCNGKFSLEPKYQSEGKAK